MSQITNQTHKVRKIQHSQKGGFSTIVSKKTTDKKSRIIASHNLTKRAILKESSPNASGPIAIGTRIKVVQEKCKEQVSEVTLHSTKT